MYQIYLFTQQELLDETFLQKAKALLPKERRLRADRYRQAIDRKNCVLTYLILQTALKDNFGLKELQIEYGTYGKPYVKDKTDIYFSISHCRLGCAVAVADTPIGVDIQEIRGFSKDVANRVCSNRELAELEVCKDKERTFIRMWTVKESYGKMKGTGILYDMKGVDTDIIAKNKIVGIIEKEKYVVAVCLEVSY